IMPRGDGTGPWGMGPMTGRAAGFCAGFGVPGYMNPIPGRAFGIGFGRGFWGRGGRGWRNWFYATGLTGWQRAAMGWPAWGCWMPPPSATPPTREQQLEVLKNQAAYFEDTLNELRKRIEELEANKAEN
ncbi:MAG: DUF5320 domain-containing protein, partial [Kiritimatiellia bacterium]